MLKRIAFIALALSLLGSLSACTFGSAVDPSLPSAGEIIGAVIESMSDMRSYQFESSMVMDATGEMDCQSFEATMDMTLCGAVDIENQQTGVEITMGMEIPGEDGMDMGMSMYVVTTRRIRKWTSWDLTRCG